MIKLCNANFNLYFLFICSLILFILFVSVSTNADEVISDIWYSGYIGNSKIGYTHSNSRLVIDNGDSLYITNIYSKIDIARDGTKISTETEVEFIEKSDCTPLKFKSRLKMANNETSTEGEIKNGQMYLKTTSYNKEENNVIQWDSDILFPCGIAKLYEKTNLVSGTRLSYKTFEPELNKVITTYISVIGNDTIRIAGSQYNTIKIKSAIDILPGIETYEWRLNTNIKTDVIKMSVPFMGITYYLTDKETALTENPTVDLMLTTRIKPIFPSNIENFSNATKITSALYKLSLTNDNIESIIIEDDRQKIESKGIDKDGTKWVLLRINAKESATNKKKLSKDLLSEYLKDNLYIQSENKKIIDTAEKIIGNEKSNIKKAQKLEKWVYDNIKDKNFDIGFASALEVLERLEGDCTEHSVLLASLCRAVKIPSRVAIGLVGFEKNFYYHMWTEVYIDKWIALDATIGQGFVDAVHIKFADSSLKDTNSILDVSLPVIKLLSGLNIEVVEIKE